MFSLNHFYLRVSGVCLVTMEIQDQGTDRHVSPVCVPMVQTIQPSTQTAASMTQDSTISCVSVKRDIEVSLKAN